MKKVYKLSEENYKQLLAVLHKFGNNKNAINLLNSADVVIVKDKKTKKNIQSLDSQKEVLTDRKMKEIFGENYQGLVFYNYDYEKWNVKNPLDSSLKNKTYALNLIKRVMDEKMQNMQMELVAIITMPVADSNYVGWGKSLQNLKYDASGHVLVGTLLWRDTNTGKLLGFADNWQQGELFLCERNSKEDAINRFVQDVMRYNNFRDGISRLR